VAELKWRSDSLASNYRKAYLHALLLLTVAHALRHNPRASYLVRFSFPLAFSAREVQQLRDCFNEAAKLVSESTGVLLEVAAGGLDESSCAKTACGAKFPNQNVLTADLGGGTLDLALWEQPRDSKPGDSTTPTLLACDSVFFGADILTECWKNLEVSVSLVGLKDQILEKGWKDTVTDAINDNTRKIRAEKARKRFDTFFVAVIEYIARFLAGTILRKKPEFHTTTVVLLGSGWRAYEASEEYGGDIEGFRRALESKLTERVKQLTSNKVGQLKIDIGKLKIDTDVRVLTAGMEKAAVVVGLLRGPEEIRPSQIMAPNGLEEWAETSNGIQTTEWWKFAGLNGDDDFLGSCRPKHDPPFPTDIACHLRWLQEEQDTEIRVLANYCENDGKHRKRPVISDVYRYYLRPALENRTEPRR